MDRKQKGEIAPDVRDERRKHTLLGFWDACLHFNETSVKNLAPPEIYIWLIIRNYVFTPYAFFVIIDIRIFGYFVQTYLLNKCLF